MKKILSLLLITFTFNCSSETPKPPQKSLRPDQIKYPLPKKLSQKEYIEKLNKKDCVEVIRCLSPGDVAREYGRTEQWVVANYMVTVWEKPTHLGKGKKVGDMRCGSRAIILERSVDDYKIISPLDKSVGWVNEVQISGTLFQHPITREPCEK